MSIRSLPACLLGIAVLFALSSPVSAAHHRWDFSEVFTNASGSVQFVELLGLVDNEQFVDGFTITSASTGKTFTFDSDLPNSSTGGAWMLIATSNWVSTGGPPADYELPSAFFDPSGDTLTYATTADTWVFGAVPTNGSDSLNRVGGVAANSPTNFTDGIPGNVNIPGIVPSIGSWGVVLLAGALLLAASGLLRRGRSASGDALPA